MDSDLKDKKKKPQGACGKCCASFSKGCGKFWKPVFAWYWRPKPSLLLNVVIFFVIAIIFLVLGSVILVKSYEIEEVKMRYDDIDQCRITEQLKTGYNGPQGKIC